MAPEKAAEAGIFTDRLQQSVQADAYMPCQQQRGGTLDSYRAYCSTSGARPDQVPVSSGQDCISYQVQPAIEVR